MSTQPTKEQMLESKRMKMAKKSYIREIKALQGQMSKRSQQRAYVIYNLANSKFQNALITARQLHHTSLKIWKQFHDEYMEQFQQNYFYKTSRTKQQTQFLLDTVLICKVYMKSKKKDDIVEMIQKIQIPQVQIVSKQELITKQDIASFNEMKQILSRTCAAFLSFIEITKVQKITQYTQKLFMQYNNFVQKYYGPFEFATARFLFASYLYEQQKYQMALNMYEACLQIRKQNCLNQGFVDVLVNSAICLHALGRIQPAIDKMRFAIQISKDLKKQTESVVDQYHLFLAKLHLQNAEFKQAFKNYLITYKLRSQLDIKNPQRIQIQMNILYFYKTLKKCVGEHFQQSFNLKDRKQVQACRKAAHQIIKDMDANMLNRQQFSKYDDFNKKMAHLTLFIPQAFFDLLNSDQVNQLNVLLQKLGSCSFPKGLTELYRSSFYEEKKTRELLMSVNPVLNANRDKNI